MATCPGNREMTVGIKPPPLIPSRFEQATRWIFAGFWTFLISVSLGSTAYALLHRSLLNAMYNNKLPFSQTLTGIKFFTVSTLLLVGLYAFILVRQKNTISISALELTKRLNWGLSFIISGPMIVALATPGIETKHPWLTCFYIALVAGAWWPTLQALTDYTEIHRLRKFIPHRNLISYVCLALLGGTYAYVMSRFTINSHHSFSTAIYDLGIYDNLFYNSSHGNPLGSHLLRGGSHLSSHFDPIIVLLSPLYRLWPRAEFLLVLQSVWCAVGVIPAFLIGRSQLGTNAWGLTLAAIYALSPALHGANLYEFHSLTLLITPLLFALYFLLSGRIKAYYITLPILFLIREDISLVMLVVGVYSLISKRPELRIPGMITIIASVLYFLCVKLFLMESTDPLNAGSSNAYSYAFYFSEATNNKGSAGLIFTLLTNPAFVVDLVTRSAKIQFLLIIFLPVLFMPFCAGRARIMLAYGLAFTLLATRAPVYTPHFQYSSSILPFAIGLTPIGIHYWNGKTARNLVPSLIGCALIATVLMSCKFGALIENKSIRGGWVPVIRSLTEPQRARYQSAIDLIAKIPPNASVTASPRTGSHVSNRPEIYMLRQRKITDYLLIDQRELKGSASASFKNLQSRMNLKAIGKSGTWQLYENTDAKTTN